MQFVCIKISKQNKRFNEYDDSSIKWSQHFEWNLSILNDKYDAQKWVKHGSCQSSQNSKQNKHINNNEFDELV